jgi:hypothetical protein
MVRPTVVLLAIATLLLASPAIQADKLVSLNLKMASLEEVGAAFKGQGVTVFVPPVSRDRKINVFADKTSALAILKAICEIVDLELVGDLAKGFELKQDRSLKQDLDAFLLAENRVNAAIAKARLTALSKAVRAEPAPGPAKEWDWKAEQTLGAEDWATWRARNSVFRLLGTIYPHQPSNWLLTDRVASFPCLFTMAPAPTPATRDWPSFLHWDIDKWDRLQEGAEASFYFNAKTGLIMAAQPKGEPSKNELPSYDLLLSPLSTAQRSTLPYGRLIDAWDKPLAVPDEPVWTRPYTHKSPEKDKDEAEARRTVSDELEAVFRETKIPIVADATRFAESPVTIPEGKNLGQWLEEFRKQQKGFARIESGMFVYRHRSYWRMQSLEVPERSLRFLEAHAASDTAGLGEYADLAFSLDQGLNILVDRALPLLFADDYIVHFDRSPIQMAWPVLVCYGCLTPAERNRLRTQGSWIDERRRTETTGRSIGNDFAAVMAAHFGMTTDAEMWLTLHGFNVAKPGAWTLNRSADLLGLKALDDLEIGWGVGAGSMDYYQTTAPLFCFDTPPAGEVMKGGRMLIKGPISVWLGHMERRYARYTFTIPQSQKLQ